MAAPSQGTLSSYNPGFFGTIANDIGGAMQGVQNWFTGNQTTQQVNNQNAQIPGSTYYTPPVSQPSPINYSSANTSYAPNQTAVLGASTSQNNNNYSSLANAVNAQNAAAVAAKNASIQQALDYYNYANAQLDLQKGDLTNAFNTGNTALKNALQQNIDQANTQSSMLNNQANQGMNQAYMNYQNLLGQNYSLARSYGINGSGLGQLINNSGQVYGNTTAGIQNDLATRLNDIQNTLSSAKMNAQNQVAQLTNQYNSAMKNIALNENQSDIQKGLAISNIQADYQKQVAGINQAVLQMQTGFAQQTAQTMAYLSMMHQDTGAAGQYLNNAQNMFSQIPTVNPSTDNNTASGGIDWSKYLTSNPLSQGQ